jgi:hypothetical protein
MEVAGQANEPPLSTVGSTCRSQKCTTSPKTEIGHFSFFDFSTFFFLPFIDPPTLVYPAARCGGLGCAFAKADKFIWLVSRELTARAHQTHLPPHTHHCPTNISDGSQGSGHYSGLHTFSQAGTHCSDH